MSNIKNQVFGIPGWGFNSDIFKHLNIEHIGLDYYELEESSIFSIAKRLGAQISNQAILLGWSLGGLIAINIAYLYPDKIKQLVLINAPPRFSEGENWIGIKNENASQFLSNAISNFSSMQQHFVRLVSYPNTSLKHRKILNESLTRKSTNQLALLNEMFSIDLREEYKSITSRITQIINDKDAVINQNAKQILALNPNVQLIRTPNGHAGFLFKKAIT